MFVVVLLVVFAILISKPPITKELVEQRFSKFKIQYEEKKTHGYDVTEAEAFARQVRHTYDVGDYAKANTLLDNAFEVLENLEKTEFIDTTSIKVETVCTDGIDNDGDGLTDNDDGNCWIREGAVFMENFCRVISFNDVEMIHKLKEIGIETIELLPIWEHINSDNPAQRWAVRNFSKLDPARGTNKELKVFLDEAHNYGLKVVTCIGEGDTGIPPTSECGHYDTDGIGGALYQYQMQNPEKDILIRDKNGDFVCSLGYGYVVNRSSGDVIEFFKSIYKQMQKHGFDGVRIDASQKRTCTEQEIVYFFVRDGKPCPHPIDGGEFPMVYYRELAKLKKPNEVFISEHPVINVFVSNWFGFYPYYPPDTMVDEVADASETPLFEILLLDHIVNNDISSSQFIEWITDEPVSYNRQRFRYVITWMKLNKDTASFITNDQRYFPLVTLVSTITGIPKVTDYELFGNKDADKYYRINGNSVETSEVRRNHWKNILGIRNQNPVLKYGTIENVWESGDNTYAYLREYEDEQVIVVINFLDKEATSYLDLPFIDKGTVLYDELSGETFTVTNLSNFKISVPAYGSRILVLERSK